MPLGLIAATFFSFAESSRFEYVGLPIIIEHPKGSVRSGTDVEGNYWEQERCFTTMVTLKESWVQTEKS